MTKLTVTRGLSGSGKSTWAKEQVLAAPAGKIVRVNRDSLRTILHVDRWHPRKTEPQTEVARDMLIHTFLKAGMDVICDDTNLAPKVMDRLREVATDAGAEFIVKDFTHVPIETCIKQDLRRLESVGEGVIRRQYRDYLAPKPTPVEYVAGLPEAIIVDVDGTIALMNGRKPFDWGRVGEDLHNQWVIDYVKRELNGDPDLKLIICSGRDGSCGDETRAWIEAQGLRPDYFFIRPAGDTRKDSIIKREIYDNEIKGRLNIRAVYDDRNQVVEMWRGLGLPVLQVANGDF